MLRNVYQILSSVTKMQNTDAGMKYVKDLFKYNVAEWKIKCYFYTICVFKFYTLLNLNVHVLQFFVNICTNLNNQYKHLL